MFWQVDQWKVTYFMLVSFWPCLELPYFANYRDDGASVTADGMT